MRLDTLARLNADRAARRGGVLVTSLEDGADRYVPQAEFPGDPFAEALETALRLGKSGVHEVDGQRFFLTVQAPAVRLIAVGAVHISQALAPMAKAAGLDLTVIDPRTGFASPERFPDVPLIAEWPDEAIKKNPLDRYTAVALLTHDPKIDDIALEAALKADCFYIGALGSKKTHAKRVERMKARGFDDKAIARIHAPIGLDIGAVTPAEIAVSIVAEIVVSMRKKPLRDEAA